MLTREEADRVLTWAAALNPGPWEAHSRTVARAAQTIAKACGLDPNKAYCLGLMHDIGRYEGVRGLHHVVAGRQLMLEKGDPEAAQTCLTHSFPIPALRYYIGRADCTPEELFELEDTLQKTVIGPYDRLIQLCDAIGMAEGVAVMECRLMDVALRHGMIQGIDEKWRVYFQIKQEFDTLCGQNIYRLFEGEIVQQLMG